MLLKSPKFKSLLLSAVALSLPESSLVVGEEIGCCGSVEQSCADATSADASSDDLVEDADAAAGVAPPVIFSAPPPTGEITGARSSLAFPSLRLSLPKITLETPELSFSGFGRGRRGAQMNIDSASAPVSHGNPLLFGHIPTGLGQPTANPNAARTPAPDDRDQASPLGAPANNGNCGDLGLNSRRNAPVRSSQQHGVAAATRQATGGNDPWKASGDVRVEECQKQVADLSAQIQGLQVAVLKLAELQEVRTSSPSQPTRRPSRVDPWSDTSEESREQGRETEKAQAERIAYLEAKLQERTIASESADQPAGDPIERPPVKASNSVSTVGAVATTARPTILNRLGGLMSKR